MYSHPFARLVPRYLTLAAVIAASPAFAVGQEGASAPPPGRVMSAAPVMSALPATSATEADIPDPLRAALPAERKDGGMFSSEEQTRIEATMSAEQRPFPLRYRDLTQNGKFYLQVPELQEIRLMPPGIALDYASRGRQQVSRYVTDAIGIAAQDRAREVEAVNNWIDRVITQKATLSASDVWLQYAFSQQMHQQLTPYRERVAAQSEPELQGYMQELSRTVEHATQLMNAAQGYEQRTAWYNVMVHFKDGLQLIQAQQRSGDAQVLKLIDEFVSENPPVPRPAGEPPQIARAGNRPNLTPGMASTLPVVDVAAERKPAEAAPAEAKTDSGSSVLGTIIGITMVAGVLAFFLVPLRKRMKKKAKPTEG